MMYMKNRLYLIGICLIVVLVSCHIKGQQNDIDNQTWYDSIFTQIEDDTNSSIPDYAVRLTGCRDIFSRVKNLLVSLAENNCKNII